MTYIPDSLRRLVTERAKGCCEYCLLNQEDHFLSHEVDHVIATKHRGETAAENLCLSCIDCNRHKGSDLASIDPETRLVALLFNPRRDSWSDHFRLDGAHIEPLTPQGRVTVYLLAMNRDSQLAKRAELIELNRYPGQ